ncbi:Callose synthase 10 [Vitis vinifera]|uniref:Callose synthase 10 n=1 Tax=Vitis vinifera TaxID=29760 RepID=A0A438CTW0_VITVI|nr:Callose synthase 10 [Vitis vinifera]
MTGDHPQLMVYLHDTHLFCDSSYALRHPDVFDRIFHISRGGISKASRVINISEDIYAGKHEG